MILNVIIRDRLDLISFPVVSLFHQHNCLSEKETCNSSIGILYTKMSPSHGFHYIAQGTRGLPETMIGVSQSVSNIPL